MTAAPKPRAAEGSKDTPAAIARRYASLADTFVLDHVDAVEVGEVRRAGLEPALADLLDPEALARAVVEGTLRH